MNGDLSNLKCSRCGSADTTWFIDNQVLCYTCAANGVVSQDILETRARKAFVPKSFNNGKDVKATVHKGHPEKDFQDTVMALLRALGFDWVRHSRPGMTSRTVNGKAVWTTAFEGDADVDILAIRTRDNRGVALELKAGKNKATPEQLACLRAFASVGWLTGVYYPDDFEELKNLLEGM